MQEHKILNNVVQVLNKITSLSISDRIRILIKKQHVEVYTPSI